MPSETLFLQKDLNERVFNFSPTAISIKKVQISPKQLKSNKFALTESFIKNQDSKYTTYGKGYRKPIIALAAFENNDRFCSTALLSEILGISSRSCDNNMRIISDYIFQANDIRIVKSNSHWVLPTEDLILDQHRIAFKHYTRFMKSVDKLNQLSESFETQTGNSETLKTCISQKMLEAHEYAK